MYLIRSLLIYVNIQDISEMAYCSIFNFLFNLVDISINLDVYSRPFDHLHIHFSSEYLNKTLLSILMDPSTWNETDLPQKLQTLNRNGRFQPICLDKGRTKITEVRLIHI